MNPRDPLVPISWDDPPPDAPGDASVELDLHGRLTVLRVRPPDYDSAPASTAPDWSRVFAAAGLDMKDFRTSDSRWVPPVGFDARAAWEGSIGGRVARVEAAAYRGKPVFVRLISPWTTATPVAVENLGSLVRRFLVGGEGLRSAAAVMLVTLLFAAFIAYRHVRIGRSDRRGARTVAVAVFALQAALPALGRHWSLDPSVLLRLVFLHVGLALSTAFAVWLLYLAMEPYARRRWPHLLIAWTRLLDGRWRDPLVGRSLLVGLVAGLGLAASAPVTGLVRLGRTSRRSGDARLLAVVRLADVVCRCAPRGACRMGIHERARAAVGVSCRGRTGLMATRNRRSQLRLATLDFALRTRP